MESLVLWCRRALKVGKNLVDRFLTGIDKVDGLEHAQGLARNHKVLDNRYAILRDLVHGNRRIQDAGGVVVQNKNLPLVLRLDFAEHVKHAWRREGSESHFELIPLCMRKL